METLWKVNMRRSKRHLPLLNTSDVSYKTIKGYRNFLSASEVVDVLSGGNGEHEDTTYLHDRLRSTDTSKEEHNIITDSSFSINGPFEWPELPTTTKTNTIVRESIWPNRPLLGEWILIDEHDEPSQKDDVNEDDNEDWDFYEVSSQDLSLASDLPPPHTTTRIIKKTHHHQYCNNFEAAESSDGCWYDDTWCLYKTIGEHKRTSQLRLLDDHRIQRIKEKKNRQKELLALNPPSTSSINCRVHLRKPKVQAFWKRNRLSTSKTCAGGRS